MSPRTVVIAEEGFRYRRRRARNGMRSPHSPRSSGVPESARVLLFRRRGRRRTRLRDLDGSLCAAVIERTLAADGDDRKSLAPEEVEQAAERLLLTRAQPPLELIAQLSSVCTSPTRCDDVSASVMRSTAYWGNWLRNGSASRGVSTGGLTGG